MALNRRTLLLGLVVLVVGAGIIGGTGAFASVQADRTMNLDTKGDAAALLQLKDEGSVLTGTENPSSTEVDILRFDQTDINANAETQFGPAFTITNNGKNDIDTLYIEENETLGIEQGGTIDFIVHKNSGGDVDASDGDSMVYDPADNSGNSIGGLAPQESVTISVVVDTTGSITGSDLPTNGTVTIVAEDSTNVTTPTN